MGVIGKDEYDDTICHQGCAMTSVSMAIAGYNISIDGAVSNPKVLNDWLRKNNGYICLAEVDCCNLELAAPDRISPMHIKSMGEPLTPNLLALQKLIDDQFVVVAHVRNQTHFVLVTSYSQPNIFHVLDPNYPVSTYLYSEIHDILLYQFSFPDE